MWEADVLSAPDGTRIDAARLEAAICAWPWVEQAVVVGGARPFVGALIVARDRGGHPGDAELRERARRDLNALNARLEPIEQIRSFELLGERFAPDLYADVAPGEVRRDRAGIAAAHAARIEALYARPCDLPMRTESARWQADAWDVSADHFDTESMSFLQRISVRAVELLPITTGARVIDCACGSGHASLAAAGRVGPEGHVIGVDVSRNLLALARAKAAARGLGNVEFQLGDMQQLALGTEQFDAVLCIFALFFVPDMVTQVRRFWSHLRPGGRLGVATWAPEALEPARGQIWLPSLRRERPDLVAQSAARDRVSEGDQLRTIFAEAEIAEVELMTCHEEQRFETPESWWEILLGLAPPRWFIDQMTPEQRARVKQANLAWVREHGLQSVNVNWIFARAIKPAPRP